MSAADGRTAAAGAAKQAAGAVADAFSEGGAAARAVQAETAAAPAVAAKRDSSSSGSPALAAANPATEATAGDAAAGEAAAAMSDSSEVGNDEEARGAAGKTAGTRDGEALAELASGTVGGPAEATAIAAPPKAMRTSAGGSKEMPAGAAGCPVAAGAAVVVEDSQSAAVFSACCVRRGARAEAKNLDGEQQGGVRVSSNENEAERVKSCKEEEDAGRTVAAARSDVEEDNDRLSRTAAGAQGGTASTLCCSPALQSETCARVAATAAAPAVAAARVTPAAASPVAAICAAARAAAAWAFACPADAGGPSSAGERPPAVPAASAALAAAPGPSDDFLFVEKMLHQELCGDSPFSTQSDTAAEALAVPSSSLLSAFCAARATAAAAASRRARRATAAIRAAASRIAEATPAAKMQSLATAATKKLPVSLATTDTAGAAVSSSEAYTAAEEPAVAAAVQPEQTCCLPVENSRRSSSSSGGHFTGSNSGSVHCRSAEKWNLVMHPPAACGHEVGCWCDNRGGGGNDGAVLLQRILEEVAVGRTAARAAPSPAATAPGSDSAAVSAVAEVPTGPVLTSPVAATTAPSAALAAPPAAVADPAAAAAAPPAATAAPPAATPAPPASAGAAATSSVVSSAAAPAESSAPAADAGDSSSTRRKWLKKQLLGDYTHRITRRVLLNATERMLLVGTINFLVVLGLSLELSVRCISVACVYVHHFFDVFSFQQLERKIVASAALLLAWKYAEDTEVSTRNTRKLYDLARGIYRVVMQQKAADLRAIREQLLLLTSTSNRRSSGFSGGSSTSDSSKSSSSSICGRRTWSDSCGDRSSWGSNSAGCEIIKEERRARTEDSRSHAGGAVAAAVNTTCGSVPCAFPLLDSSSAAASPPSVLPLTNYVSGGSSSCAGSFFPHAEVCLASVTHPAVSAHAAPDIPVAAACAATAGPPQSVAASATASATAAGEKSAFVRRAAAAFSVLLAEDVIADVVSSSRWLLRDDGASFRSLCQKLRVYEAAVLRAVRFDVSPHFIPLPAIRLYVKLFLVKCCWCCLATPASAAGGRSTCTHVTSEPPISCTMTTKPPTPCWYAAADLSPSPAGCCPTAYTKSVASCRCVSSSKTPSLPCPCWFQDRDVPLFSSHLNAAGESAPTSCCCAAGCGCCSSSTYSRVSCSSTCCCSEWPAAGLPYVQLQRRLHAEALQQLLFLCRTPFLIERSPNAVAAACVIKAAIECGLPFLMSAQQHIKLATATWRQLQHQRSLSTATSPQQVEKHSQQENWHQQQPTKVKQEAEEQRPSAVEKDKLRAFPKRQKPEKRRSSIIGTIGRGAALLALESFDRHVSHFIYAINHPYGSCAIDDGCYGDSAAAPVTASSHEFTGTAGTRFTQRKAAAVNKPHEVLYSVDSGEVRRVLAELRLASTWMGELLRVTGAEATSLMQPLSKEVRKKRVKRAKVDGSSISCNRFSALFETSAAAGAPSSTSDRGCSVAAAVGGGGAAPGAEPGIPPGVTTSAPVHTPESATFCRLPGAPAGGCAVDAACDAPAPASGFGSEAVACSVEELLLQGTVKLGGKQEQAIQQKRLKRCMEYIRNVLGKRPSDDEPFTTVAAKPEAKQRLQHTAEEEEVLQLHHVQEQTHTRHVKGNDQFASVY